MTEDIGTRSATIRIALSPVMDRSAMDRHLDEFKTAFANGHAVEIACGDVQQIGQAGLQLLVSAIRTGRERGNPVSFSDCNGIESAVRLSGMSELFFGNTASTVGAEA